MLNQLKNLAVNEQGQGMTEYGLILGVISVAIIGGFTALRSELISMFDHVISVVNK